MEEHLAWLKKAEQDLDTALYNLDGKKLEAGIFFLQQAAEKALKAFYIKKFKRLFRTHDLVILSRDLSAPENIVDACKKLSPAYQYTRYPDVVEEAELENRLDEFVSYSKEIIKWVKENI